VTPDRVLHRGVEILDAHRDAREAALREPSDLLGGRDARVDLDGDLRAGRERERRLERIHQARHLRGREEGRRPAAPMELHHPPPVAERAGDERDLALEVVEVAVGEALIAADDDVAAAEGAAFRAEREVHVRRERVVGPAGGGREGRGVRVGPEALVELDGGRVGRVAGAGPVVAREALRRRSGVGGGGHRGCVRHGVRLPGAPRDVRHRRVTRPCRPPTPPGVVTPLRKAGIGVTTR
jgi:hypothetical protein